ncbi:MEKHLA domain-containing protein [Rhizobium sp. Root708]|uniref:MEKHLA domain-containing protein n=1 Tax=Rhizobium sp. Root708 TaxID=1736592 RepID=UPI000ADE4824|nr:MEKHLA domain-containing protein [Rhizobium sp. Root708]
MKHPLGAAARTPDLSTDLVYFKLLTESYQRLVGKPLVDPALGPTWLYRSARFIVVAHNTDPDPRFVYANQSAQDLFGYGWEEFTSLPSRLSAEAPDREERQRLLDAVGTNGFIENYRGLRVRKSGARFWMEDGLVWQLMDADGKHRGQAATFSRWTDEV